MRVSDLLRITSCAGFLVGGAFAVAQAAPPPTVSRPNIILCMADDQGWGDMAYNGHPHLKTPVFDEMARTGVRFDRFYAAAPVCSPTRASVLTGRTPNRSGVFSWGHSLRPQEVTVAEELQQAGYVTGHFGKWHLGSVLAESATSPGAQGFDEWLSAPNFFEIDPWLSRKGAAEQRSGEGSAVIVAAAVDFIRQVKVRQQPFFAVIWFGSPHAPHSGLPEDLQLYADRPPPEQRFLAEITAMDRAMGTLRQELTEMQLAQNTLLWYCSDNGAIPVGSTGGLRGKKGTLYEGGLRVPSLLEWPARFAQPMVIEAPAGTVDLLPTVLDAAGIAQSQQRVLDGESLLPILSGASAGRQRPLGFWDAGRPGFATPSDKILAAVADRRAEGLPIDDPAALGLPPAPLEWNLPDGQFPGHSAWIADGWKIHRIEHPRTREVRWELYHLASDPTESRDQWMSEAQRGSEMQTALEVWLASVTRSLAGADYATP